MQFVDNKTLNYFLSDSDVADNGAYTVLYTIEYPTGLKTESKRFKSGLGACAWAQRMAMQNSAIKTIKIIEPLTLADI